MEVKPINGFSRRLHPYQILSYFFFFILVVSYFLLTFCLSRNVLKIVGGSLEFVLGITIVISGYLSTAIDPSDSYLKASLKAKKANLPYNPPVEEYFCNIDYAYVHESSKHCKRCNRCTENFDHHCKWINNDVGKKNYKPFFVLITSVLFFLLVYLAMTIVVTVEFAKDNSLPDNNVFLYDTTGKIRVAIIVLWVVLAFSLVFLLLDLNLVLFHIFLIKKGLTTFQYIVLTEERKEQKREHERARRMLGEKKISKTCLDYVLCLKRKKKKKADVTQRSSQPPEHPENRLDQGNERVNSHERQRSVVLEMAEQGNNNEDMERVDSQADEPYSKLDVKENDTRDPDIIYKGEMLEENGNPLVVEDVNEGDKKERIATAQSDREKTVKRPQSIETNLRAENYRQSGGNMLDIIDINDPKKISPTFSSVDEFGERSARGYNKNKEVLNKNFEVETWKNNGEARKSREGPISIQILDEPDISHIKGKEPGSNVYNREHNSINSTAVGKENRDGIGFKRRSVDGQVASGGNQDKEPYIKTEESEVLKDRNE